jgi:hypothetical protein
MSKVKMPPSSSAFAAHTTSSGILMVNAGFGLGEGYRQLETALDLNLIERRSKYHPEKMTVVRVNDSEALIGVIGVSIN